MVHSFLDTDKDLGIKDFSGFINEAARRARGGKSAVNMYSGDMWDYGKGYIGPVPVTGDTHYGDILLNIKRTFVGRNVIEEVVDRQVDALLSKSPDWKIYNKTAVKEGKKTPDTQTETTQSDSLETAAEKEMGITDVVADPKISEAEMLLSEVWNKAKLGDALKDSLTSRMISGRGILRLYLHGSFLKKQDQIKDFLDIAKYVRVEWIPNDKANVLDDGTDRLSIVELSPKKDKTKKLEISFVDDNDKTFVATIEQGLTANSEPDGENSSDAIASIKKNAKLSSAFSMQGEITVDEILGKPFVSQTMLQNNRALNLDLSLGVGVLIESGYAEMVMTNVSMETRDVTDPNDSTKTIKVPVGLKRGPGVANNLIGEQTVNAQGETKFEQPSVYFKEPSPLDTFVVGENLYYRQILSEAKQIHILIVGDAKASGEARIQARQDFVKKSQRYKPSLDVHGSWLLNAILNFAASAINKDDYFSELGVLFDSKIYAGELSADEQNVVVSRYEKGLISRETAITLLGSEEPILEIEKIKKDEAAKLALQVKRLEATVKFGNTIANGAPSTSGQPAGGDNTVAGTAGSTGAN
jgi:hypothetical protein